MQHSKDGSPREGWTPEEPEPHWRQGLIDAAAGKRTALGVARAERAWSSRALHVVGEWTAHAWAGLVAALALLVWMCTGVVAGFPSWWQTTLYSVSSAVTLLMVFALQHTQARQQSATQRKLDELLRAQPSADHELIAVEEAPDEELEALTTKNLGERQRAVESGQGES